MLSVHELAHASGHGGRRLGGRQAVGAPAPTTGVDSALQRGHAHHEELVQVRAEDREELHPLQQRHARILGLLEHAPVELEPRQLAVDERARVHAYGRRPNVSRRSTPSLTPREQTTSVRYPP